MRIDRITLEDLSQDGLSGARWTFFLLDARLVVDTYQVWSKPSSRAKAQLGKHWSRLNSRDSSIKRADVPFDEVIAARAKAAFLAMMEASLTVEFQAGIGK